MKKRIFGICQKCERDILESEAVLGIQIPNEPTLYWHLECFDRSEFRAIRKPLKRAASGENYTLH